MKKLIQEMKDVMEAVFEDIGKPTKAAQARVRKATLELAKLGKQYRKESITMHK